MKYLVMECHLSHAVVLSDDGRFLKVANLRYEVGQSVEDIIEMQVPDTPAVRFSARRLMPLAAMAACLVLVLSVLFFRVPCASVYLTINPEVRIDVNRSDTVVGVAGVNADGSALLEGYDHRRKPLDTVMDELVDRAIAMGYLSDGGTVTLTLDADDAWVVSHSGSLGTHLNEHLSPVISVTIEIAAPGSMVIPVDPSYSDADYGDIQPATQLPTGAHGDNVTDTRGDSGYHEHEHGDSHYDADDGDSGYDD